MRAYSNTIVDSSKYAFGAPFSQSDPTSKYSNPNGSFSYPTQDADGSKRSRSKLLFAAFFVMVQAPIFGRITAKVSGANQIIA